MTIESDSDGPEKVDGLKALLSNLDLSSTTDTDPATGEELPRSTLSPTATAAGEMTLADMSEIIDPTQFGDE